MKTPIDIRVTNLESSKAFEDKVRKLVNFTARRRGSTNRSRELQ